MTEKESSYVLVTKDGVKHGPLPRYRVLELLERGFVDGQDRVGREGGEMRPLAYHSDFAGYFIEGDSRHREIRSKQLDRAARNRNYRARKKGKQARRVLFWLMLLALPFFVFRLRFILFPDAALDWMHARVYGDFDAEGGQVASGGDGAGSGGATRHQKGALVRLIEGLRGQAVGMEISGPKAYAQGWEVLVGSKRGSPSALDYMRHAVQDSEGADWAVGGLLAAMAQAKQGEHDADSRAWMAALEREGLSTAAEHTAKAAFALYAGNHGAAVQHAGECRKFGSGPAECSWMEAVAIGRSGQAEHLAGALSTGLAVYPESPELHLWSAFLARETHDYLRAFEELAKAKEALDGRWEYHRESALLAQATGRYGAARKAAVRWGELAVDPRSARLFESILLYQVEGLHERGARQLSDLANEDLEDFPEKWELFLHASHASRRAGDLVAALDFAKRAIGENDSLASGHLAEALAHEAAGDLSLAESAWLRIDLGSLTGREGARAHVWASQFYLRSDRVRLALERVKSAELEDPSWPDVFLAGSRIDLRLQDISGLFSRLERAVSRDLEQESRRLPVLQNHVLAVDLAPVVAALTESVGRDPRQGRRLASASGVVRLLGCNAGPACPRAVSELQRALRLDPDDGLALAASAHLDLRNERWESLLSASTLLLKREMNNAVFKAMEGRALLGLGRDEVALASLREAHRLDANGTAAAHGLVSALNQAGRTEEVGPLVEEVRRRDPNDSVTAGLLLHGVLDRDFSAE